MVTQKQDTVTASSFSKVEAKRTVPILVSTLMIGIDCTLLVSITSLHCAAWKFQVLYKTSGYSGCIQEGMIQSTSILITKIYRVQVTFITIHIHMFKTEMASSPGSTPTIENVGILKL